MSTSIALQKTMCFILIFTLSVGSKERAKLNLDIFTRLLHQNGGIFSPQRAALRLKNALFWHKILRKNLSKLNLTPS